MASLQAAWSSEAPQVRQRLSKLIEEATAFGEYLGLVFAIISICFRCLMILCLRSACYRGERGFHCHSMNAGAEGREGRCGWKQGRTRRERESEKRRPTQEAQRGRGGKGRERERETEGEMRERTEEGEINERNIDGRRERGD